MRVAWSRRQRVVRSLPTVAFSFISVLGGALLVWSGRSWPSLLFFAAPAIAWYSHRRIAWSLAVEGENLVAERPSGKLVLQLADVRHVDVRAWNRGVVAIATEQRRMHLDRHIPGLARLLSDTFVGRADVRIRGSMPAYVLENAGSLQPRGEFGG